MPYSPKLFRSLGFLIAVIMAVFSGLSFPTLVSAQAQNNLTVDSPEVINAVKKGIHYLKQNGAKEKRPGGISLIALAALKAGEDEQHPLIRRGLDTVRQSIDSQGEVKMNDPIYSVGISIIFIGDLDPVRYRRELTALSNFIRKNQRSDGSWTYLTSGSADAYPTGDMSMTQYGVMGFWVLKQHGYTVSDAAVNRAGMWLMVAQNDDGQYAYMTKIGPNYNVESRSGLKPSTTAAGMASVYAVRDMFGMNDDFRNDDNEKKGLPDAFKKVRSPGDEELDPSRAKLSFSKNEFTKVQTRGDDWLGSQFAPINGSMSYLYYYLYAIERYWSFREIAENKVLDSPPWYNTAARFLINNQKPDGSWEGSGCGTEVDTAYAILVLLRSTRLSIHKDKVNLLGGGNMQGGRGLPKSTADVRIRDGQIVDAAEILNTDQLQEKLDDLKALSDDDIKAVSQLSGEELESLYQKQKSNIRNLVSSKNAGTRYAAVVLLGKSGDIRACPTLLYAMNDEDEQVAQAALESIRRIARDPKGNPLPPRSDPGYAKKHEETIKYWKNWYKAIEPNARFESD